MADMILLPLLAIGACFLLHNMQGFSVLTLKVSILGPSETMMPPKSEATHLTLQLKSHHKPIRIQSANCNKRIFW